MHPEHSPESLAARLRSLAPPPFPEGLEARLLAGVPARRRRRFLVLSLTAALAAACLLAVLAWSRRDTPLPRPDGKANTPVTKRASDPETLTARLNLDELPGATFNWPLEEALPLTVTTAIPSDLLN